MKTWGPHDYQVRAVDFCVQRSHAGLLLFPGLGKTSIALEVYRQAHCLDESVQALVVSPLRPTYEVWPREVDKWENFKHLTYKILHGPDKDKLLRINTNLTFINYEGLQWLASQRFDRRNPWPWQLLIVDESSFVKNSATKRFKALKHLLPRFLRRYILTGSPSAKNLLDLFGQMYVVDQGATLGKYITHYRNRFFRPSGFKGYQWKPLPHAEAEIHELIAPKLLSMNSADYLKLPPLVVRDIEVILPKEARKTYREMEKQLFTKFHEGKVSAANAAVAGMKCHQVVGGNLYLDNSEKKEYVHIHDEKENLLVDLLSELEGHPTIIGYWFNHERERIIKILKSKLGITPAVIGKGVSPTQVKRVIDQWNKGEISVLLGHPQSMAHGLNLQAGGRAIIWYTLPWSYDLYSQMIQRIWRQGQEKRVFVYRLVAKRTVDEAVVKALKRKVRVQNQVFRAIKEYWLEHDETAQPEAP